jgi:hypothetical protein
MSHTNLIKLNGIELCPLFGQESLAGLAVRAVGFAEYRYTKLVTVSEKRKYNEVHTHGILINDVLGLGLGGRHVCRVDGRRSEEST